MTNSAASAREPVRSGCLGKASQGCGSVLAIVALILLCTPAMPLGFLVLLPAGLLHWWGRRLSAPKVEQIRAHDPRRPVLYLRSFDLDRKVYGSAVGNIGSVLPRGLRDKARPVLEFGDAVRQISGIEAIERFGGDTVEEKVIQAFAEIGPLVAVGKPGEFAPLPGIPRVSLGDDWKDHVIQEIRKAGLVLIQPWFSSAVYWEIQIAIQHADPRRVVLFFWRVSDADYEKLRASVKSAISLSLPPASIRHDGDDLICFDADGNARFVSISQRRGLGKIWMDTQDLRAVIAQIKRELDGLPPPKG